MLGICVFILLFFLPTGSTPSGPWKRFGAAETVPAPRARKLDSALTEAVPPLDPPPRKKAGDADCVKALATESIPLIA